MQSHTYPVCGVKFKYQAFVCYIVMMKHLGNNNYPPVIYDLKVPFDDFRTLQTFTQTINTWHIKVCYTVRQERIRTGDQSKSVQRNFPPYWSRARLATLTFYAACTFVLLFLVLAGNSARFNFYVVTRSYSSRPFLHCLNPSYYLLGKVSVYSDISKS